MSGENDEGTRGDEDNTGESRNKGPTLTHSQSVNRLHDIRGEMARLDELDRMAPEDEVYFGELRDEFDEVDEHRKRLERRHTLARIQRADSAVDQSIRGLRLVPGSTQGTRDDYDRDFISDPDSVADHRFKNPWDLRDVRTHGRDNGDLATEYRSRALSCIEKMPGCNDKIRAAATNIIEKFDSRDSRLARQCIVTSQPAYVRAFGKMAAGKQFALTVDEQRAVAEVDEFRAMSLTDAAGGFLTPFQLDPTIIVLSSGVRSDIRQVARTVVAIADVWYGVSSSNVSWSFDAEATEVSDDAPTFAQPTIPNFMARGFVPISIEAMQDEMNVAQDVGMLLAGGKTDLEGTKFILGSGTAEPTGLITALVAAGGSTVVTGTGGVGVFALKDLYSIQGSLPARFRPNASWLANNLIYNTIRQFDTAGGAGMWVQLPDDRPVQLLGRPALEAEAMVGTTTTSSKNLVFGDFSNFVITDRIGMAVEFIPHLVGANRRPTGQRGWFAYYRTGSGVVNPGAFRLLSNQ